MKATLWLSVSSVVPMSGSTESIVVSGSASTVNACSAGVPSTSRTSSIARTENVYSPGARSAYEAGDEQASYVAPSSEHSKSRSSGCVALSEPLNSIRSSVPAGTASGADVMVVSGAAWSTTSHSYSAGIWS